MGLQKIHLSRGMIIQGVLIARKRRATELLGWGVPRGLPRRSPNNVIIPLGGIIIAERREAYNTLRGTTASYGAEQLLAFKPQCFESCVPLCMPGKISSGSV